jgi:hypothetical protein
MPETKYVPDPRPVPLVTIPSRNFGRLGTGGRAFGRTSTGHDPFWQYTPGSSDVTGDILSVAIDADGWTASITIKGLSTGGTYAMGLGTNNTTSGSTKIAFTVVSMGFDDTGAATTITRTVYGTKQLRKAYPNNAINDETVSGSNVIVRVTLSDYIYVKDKSGSGNSGTDVRVNILSGFYTSGGTPNNARSNLLVSNNSTAPYPKVIGNWTWPGYERVEDAHTTLRAACFHRHGQSQRPVRCVKFVVTAGAVTNEKISTTPVIDSSGMPDDQVPVIEYVGIVDLVGVADGSDLTYNFVAYPWVGDSASVLDSSAGTAAPTPLVGPITGLLDILGNYGVTFALVDTATGNDATGQAYDLGTYDPVTAARFLTIGKAAAAIAAFNNTNHSRNDVGAGIIELEAGNYSWLGSSNSYGTTPKTWITIRPKSGVARASVVINAASGNGDISDRIRLENLTITVTTNNTFTNINAIWLHKCDINSTGTGLFNTTGGVCWMTHGVITGFSQGLRPLSTNNCVWALVRGNLLTGHMHTTLCYTVVGNKRTTRSTPSATLFTTEINGLTAPQPVNFIIAFNKMEGFEVGASLLMVEVGVYLSNTVGGAIVQNVFENCNGSGGMGDIGSSDFGTINTPVDNIMVWHNTFVGQRNFVGYNDAGTTRKDRRYWSVLNNYFDRSANKNDTHPPGNAVRVGNWPVTFQVGGSGNCHEQNMISVPGSFYFEFAGLSTYQPPTTDSGTLVHADFISRASYDGTNPGAGDGNYDINSGSPLKTLPIVQVLPFDIAGVSRTGANSAGAYS